MLALMSIAFVGIILSESILEIVSGWLGTKENKAKSLEFIGIGMGGVLTTIGAVAFSRRSDAQARNNELIEKGHINDRFQQAAVNLGHKKRRVRITSFYQFYYLAKVSEDDFKKSVFDILCDHLRHMTSGQFYNDPKEGKDIITDECQTLLNILFKPEYKPVFDEFYANLENINLTRADLSSANFVEANFSRAVLFHADFKKSILKKVKMRNTNLQCAMFNDAILPEADFTDATLLSANFQRACLAGADFSYAKLTGARFPNANLAGACFVNATIGPISSDVMFSRANLANTNFEGVDLRSVYLMNVRNIEGADFTGAKVYPEQLPTGSGKYIADWTNDEFWAEVEKNEKS